VKSTTVEPTEFFLVARIGPSDRLIELSVIREIVPAMQLARPTGLGGGCCGVANVRGEVVPVFDLLQRGGEFDVSQLIVIAHEDQHGNIGIVVDDVLDVIELPTARIAAHPAGLGRRVRSANLFGNTLTVLAVSEVVDAA
jgi:chemotaxis signal transduction protein